MESAAVDMALEGGETIAFMGDSITQAGNRKNGYIQLVMEALNHEGLNVGHIPDGKSGNKSINMLNRLDQAVISKNPDDTQLRRQRRLALQTRAGRPYF